MAKSDSTYPWKNYQRVHVAVAERALGKSLPKGADVHHFDGDKTNNTNTNLVICQSRAYHFLLHVRQRVKAAGGDPNTQRLCADCKQLVAMADFPPVPKRIDGIGNQCRACVAARMNRRYHSRAVISEHKCECGCGERTMVNGLTGAPNRYCLGHNRRRR